MDVLFKKIVEVDGRPEFHHPNFSGVRRLIVEVFPVTTNWQDMHYSRYDGVTRVANLWVMYCTHETNDDLMGGAALYNVYRLPDGSEVLSPSGTNLEIGWYLSPEELSITLPLAMEAYQKVYSKPLPDRIDPDF